MKKRITAILAVCLLLSLTACSSKGEPNPYSVNILYQASDSESCFIYSFTIGQYRDVGAPEFMGIPLWMDFDGHYLLVSSDGSMEYREKPFDSVNGTPLENGGIPSDTKQQLIQTIQETDPTLLEGWDMDSILVDLSCSTESGMAIAFTDTLNQSFVHIAEFDADGNLTRFVEVEKLNHAMVESCTIYERTPA
jgi:hypothetical protein